VLLQGSATFLETGNKSQYTPGVPFPIHKKAQTSRTPPSSSKVDLALVNDLISSSSQMVTFMMESKQERSDLIKQRLDIMRQQEQRAAEQHRSQVLAQQAPIYQSIISNHDLPDEVREEAHQALMKLLRGG
jgi:transcription initiation factor TFIIIB Brf1 subunit/transcription initiation factor TFIIB